MAASDNKRGSSGRNGKDSDSEANCKMCKHKHRNKNCFKQHPELRSIMKNKGKAWAAFEKTEIDFSRESDSDSDSDCAGFSAVARASSSKFINRLLYDTGASHHFMRKKSDFLVLKELRKPFEYDQAVGYSRLSYKTN